MVVVPGVAKSEILLAITHPWHQYLNKRPIHIIFWGGNSIENMFTTVSNRVVSSAVPTLHNK